MISHRAEANWQRKAGGPGSQAGSPEPHVKTRCSGTSFLKQTTQGKAPLPHMPSFKETSAFSQAARSPAKPMGGMRGTYSKRS